MDNVERMIRKSLGRPVRKGRNLFYPDSTIVNSIGNQLIKELGKEYDISSEEENEIRDIVAEQLSSADDYFDEMYEVSAKYLEEGKKHTVAWLEEVFGNWIGRFGGYAECDDEGLEMTIDSEGEVTAKDLAGGVNPGFNVTWDGQNDNDEILYITRFHVEELGCDVEVTASTMWESIRGEYGPDCDPTTLAREEFEYHDICGPYLSVKPAVSIRGNRWKPE